MVDIRNRHSSYACRCGDRQHRSVPLFRGGPPKLAFSLGGVSFRHTRDFSEISVNKINNLRKSDYPEIFRGAKNIFREKKTPCNRYQKISTTVFWRIRPKLTFQKSVKTPIKKKSNRRLFPQLPSHEKAADKICKVWSLGHSSRVWARIA